MGVMQMEGVVSTTAVGAWCGDHACFLCCHSMTFAEHLSYSHASGAQITCKLESPEKLAGDLR